MFYHHVVLCQILFQVSVRFENTLSGKLHLGFSISQTECQGFNRESKREDSKLGNLSYGGLAQPVLIVNAGSRVVSCNSVIFEPRSVISREVKTNGMSCNFSLKKTLQILHKIHV